MTHCADYVVRQLISGQVLFVGMALCLLGGCLRTFCTKTRIYTLARVTALIGVLLVVLSAAPFPIWQYALFLAFLALVVFRPVKRLWQRTGFVAVLLALLTAQGLAMVWAEVRCSLPPKIPLPEGIMLYVVGDSISMGADPPGKNWPDLLGEMTGLKVRNLSFGGAKVATALDNALRINQDDALVILEIGGNDLLGGTSIRAFRQDLEQMLDGVCRPNRRVVMIELPLPPFCNRYGRVQRALARSYGVTLIPKRCLARVITTPHATVDGLHLSNLGHALFARSLFELFVPPPPASTPKHAPAA